uniref:Ovule protein n=1 Tax=Ascaris lumbricoides TaxID=6252 RepID=A0A0M3I0D1_ASCLU
MTSRWNFPQMRMRTSFKTATEDVVREGEIVLNESTPISSATSSSSRHIVTSIENFSHYFRAVHFPVGSSKYIVEVGTNRSYANCFRFSFHWFSKCRA